MRKQPSKNDYGNLREKTISVRLEAVTSSTSRARKSFLIMTIFCASISIAIWNGYLSWVRDMALPENNVPNNEKCGGNQCSCNTPLLQTFVARVKAKKVERLKENSNVSTNSDTTPDPPNNASGQSTNKNVANANQAVPNSAAVTAKQNRDNLVREWVNSQTISINLLGIRLTTYDLAVLGSLSLVVIMIWHFFVIRRENRAIVPFLKDVYSEVIKTRSSTRSATQENSELANLVFLGIANNTIFINIAENDNPSKLTVKPDGTPDIQFERKTINSVLSLVFALFISIEGFALWAAYWLWGFYELFLFFIILCLSTILVFILKKKVEYRLSEIDNTEKSADREPDLGKQSENEAEIEKQVKDIKAWWKKYRDEVILFRRLLDLMVYLPSITIFLIILTDVSSLFDYSAYREPDMLLIEAICLKSPEIFHKIFFFDGIALISFLMTTYLSSRCLQFTKASSESLNLFFNKFIKQKEE